MSDQRAKLLAGGLFSSFSLAPTSPHSIALAASGLLLWTLSAQVPAMRLARALRKTSWFLGAIILANALTMSGTVVFEAGGFYVTREGFASGLDQVARLMLVL